MAGRAAFVNSPGRIGKYQITAALFLFQDFRKEEGRVFVSLPSSSARLKMIQLIESTRAF